MTDFELGGVILLAAFFLAVIVGVGFGVYVEIKEGRAQYFMGDLFWAFLSAAKTVVIVTGFFLVICALSIGVGALARWIFG